MNQLQLEARIILKKTVLRNINTKK